MRFTDFDDAIIVFVTLQPQNILFKKFKFNKKQLKQSKNHFYHLPNSF